MSLPTVVTPEKVTNQKPPEELTNQKAGWIIPSERYGWIIPSEPYWYHVYKTYSGDIERLNLAFVNGGHIEVYDFANPDTINGLMRHYPAIKKFTVVPTDHIGYRWTEDKQFEHLIN